MQERKRYYTTEEAEAAVDAIVETARRQTQGLHPGANGETAELQALLLLDRAAAKMREGIR